MSFKALKNTMRMEEKMNKKNKQTGEWAVYITYDKLFWLFLIGSVAGVVIEGVFTLVTKGHWESHVVSVFGAFNILYGFGGVLFYVGAVKLSDRPLYLRVLVMTFAATILELLSGLLLRYGLGMRAWNYEHNFLNYKGLICLSFSGMWGIAAFIVCKISPYIDKILGMMRGKYWHVMCVALSVFMIIDMSMTAISFVRWSGRHYGIAAGSDFMRQIDIDAPDEWMQKRFMEWHFLD